LEHSVYIYITQGGAKTGPFY